MHSKVLSYLLEAVASVEAGEHWCSTAKHPVYSPVPPFLGVSSIPVTFPSLLHYSWTTMAVSHLGYRTEWKGYGLVTAPKTFKHYPKRSKL